MVSIIVAGEALVDLIVAPNGDLSAIPGGGPYNTARTIARLGGQVAFLGRLSDDRFGRMLRAALSADGISMDLVAATDAPTTLAVAELDAEGAASYRFYLHGTSAPGLTEADAAGAAVLAPAALHVGSLGLVMEPIGSTLEGLVVSASPSTTVMLDPNARPSATPDPAAFRARIRRLATRADVVKVSDDDLAFLTPDGSADEAVEQMLAAGVRVVLRTDGGRAVEVRGAAFRSVIPVPAVDVVDSVGAGDAFGGGFLAAWVAAGRDRTAFADQSAVEDAVRLGIRVASITVTRAGADPPTLAELDLPVG